MKAIVAIGIFVLLALGVTGFARYGESRGAYEQRRAIESVRARHATNLNAFINFDYRGFDTLGEEYIFFIAVGGFALLLRERRQNAHGNALAAPAPGREPTTLEPVLRVVSRCLCPVLVVYGTYIVLHGQLTPGGGFQGGVIIATAALCAYLALEYAPFSRLVNKDVIEAIEAVAAVGYIACGIVSLFATGIFLRNIMPIGSTGALVSSGQILALNDLVGVAIAAGFVVVFVEFIKETLAEAAPDAA